MIPLSVPYLEGNELKYVEQCIKTGWISSAGEYVNTFEESIKNYVSSSHAIACMNGTVGLQIALHVAGVRKSDMVLTTNLTFVATLNSISYCDATPVLFDIDKKTWQIDLNLVQMWLDENTALESHDGQLICKHKQTHQKISAIVPVHVLGGMVDMDKLLEISKTHHIPIIEDSTEALGSFYNGQHSGTFGRMGVFSFNGNKIISTGGGGMVVTNHPDLAKKTKHLTTTAKTSQLDYFHDEVGYNYRLVNVLAAIGVAQMENFDLILKKKKTITQTYLNELSELEGLIFQEHYPRTSPNGWLFTFRSPKSRELLNHMNKQKIQTRPFWTPMNMLPMYSKCEYVNRNDVTAQIFNECVSIPSSSNLSSLDQEKVVETIKNFYK